MTLISNRYEVFELIGAGGMGNVYKGKDIQTGQLVAIKHLKPEIVGGNPELVERFAREGEMLRQLNHPNIVAVLASVEEVGNHYLVMEYVSGGSLKEALEQEGRLPLRRVLEIALDLADALTRTHRLQITHRDLKPANVLLSEDGTPRLTDFGIARVGARNTKLTSTGSILGTYYYLSPEACVGEILDHRADIWAFGVILYEMLTETLPFEGAHEAAILLAILNNPPPDLSELRPDVPIELVTLIEQMLVKDRDQRIDSIRVVGAELEAILRHIGKQGDGNVSATPTGATGSSRSRFSTPTTDKSASKDNSPPTFITTPQSSATPAIKPVQSTRGTLPEIEVAVRLDKPVKVGGALLLVGLIALLVLWVGGVFSGSDDDPAQGDSNRSTAIPVVTSGAGNKQIVLVAQLESLGSTERDVSRFIVDNLRQKLEREVTSSRIRIFAYPGIIKSDEEARAVAEANRASVIVWGNYDDDMIEVEVQAGSIAAYPLMTIPREKVDEIANVRVHLSNERQQSIAPQVVTVLGVLYTADGDAYRVIQNLAILPGLEVDYGEIVGLSAAAHTHRGFINFITDGEASIEALDAAKRVAPNNPLLYVIASSVYARMGDIDEAAREIESAQRIAHNDQWAVLPYQLANLALYDQNLELAEQYYDEVIRLRPDDWFAYNFRAALHYIQRNYDLAEADYAEAFAREPDSNFPYPFSVGLALREGDFGRAQTLMREVAEKFPDPSLGNRIVFATYGDSYPIPFDAVFATFGNLVLGQYDNVITEADAGLAENDQFTELWMMKGLAHCSLEDYAAAEDAYTHAIEIDPDFVFLYFLRAEVRIRQGNLAGATEDSAEVQGSPAAERIAPYVEAGISGDMTCRNFFSYELEQ